MFGFFRKKRQVLVPYRLRIDFNRRSQISEQLEIISQMDGRSSERVAKCACAYYIAARTLEERGLKIYAVGGKGQYTGLPTSCVNPKRE